MAIEVKGLRRSGNRFVSDALNALERLWQDPKVRRDVGKLMRPVRSKALASTPIRTGALRRSLGTRVSRRKRGQNYLRISVGYYPKRGQNVRYSQRLGIEYGNVKTRARNVLGDAMESSINKIISGIEAIVDQYTRRFNEGRLRR